MHAQLELPRFLASLLKKTKLGGLIYDLESMNTN